MPRSTDSETMARRLMAANVNGAEARSRMWGILALLLAWVVILSLVPLLLLALVAVQHLRGLM